MRKITCLLLLLCLLPSFALADKTITLTFTGDITLGGEDYLRTAEDSFFAVYEREGAGYFLKNFADFFAEDDLTVVNLEGVLTDNNALYPRDKGKGDDFCFGGNRKAYQENKNRTPAVQDAAPALMLRAVLTFDDDGTYKGQQITLYPVQTTGIDRAAGDTVQVNNYQPKFITGPLAAHVLHLMQIDMNYDASKTPKYSNAESINKTLRALVIAREEELAAMDSSEGREALTLPFLPAEAE